MRTTKETAVKVRHILFYVITCVLVLVASGCGSSGSDDSITSAPSDPAETSTWGEMEWDKGTWGK